MIFPVLKVDEVGVIMGDDNTKPQVTTEVPDEVEELGELQPSSVKPGLWDCLSFSNWTNCYCCGSAFLCYRVYQNDKQMKIQTPMPWGSFFEFIVEALNFSVWRQQSTMHDLGMLKDSSGGRLINCLESCFCSCCAAGQVGLALQQDDNDKIFKSFKAEIDKIKAKTKTKKPNVNTEPQPNTTLLQPQPILF